MTTSKPIALAVFTLLLGGFVGFAFGARYSTWHQGSIVAEAKSGYLKIRQIPTHLPGLNDSYAYRCEIWGDGLLFKATTLYYRDFAAQAGKCSIDVLSSSRAIFHIDGYDIECTNWGLGSDRECDATWTRLNQ